MKKAFRYIFALLIVLVSAPAMAGEHDMHMKHDSDAMSLPTVHENVIHAGKKYHLGDEYSYSYEFSTRPKLGMIVVKLELLGKNKKRSSDFQIVGDTYMPAMKEAHGSGDVSFKLNKEGYYLLPVNVVMRGKWVIDLKFSQEGKEVHKAKIWFEV